MSQSVGPRAPLVLSGKDAHVGIRPDMKTRHLALLMISALAVGIGSGWALLGERPPFGSVRLGPWESFPRIGSSDVDPYGRAILARGVHLPLAAGEGIQLTARTDSSGSALQARCSYAISGSTLPSRGWTLTVTDRQNRAMTGQDAAAVGNADLITDETGRVLIRASSTVSPHTWLKLPDEGRFGLILRFYDTPASASIGQLEQTALPRIERLTCRNTS